MPPLQLNEEEMNVLLTLAGPIDHPLPPQSLQEVAQVVSNAGWPHPVTTRALAARGSFQGQG
jgi:hypothetical protein